MRLDNRISPVDVTLPHPTASYTPLPEAATRTLIDPPTEANAKRKLNNNHSLALVDDSSSPLESMSRS